MSAEVENELATALRHLTEAVARAGDQEESAPLATAALLDAQGRARQALNRYDQKRLPGYAY